MAGASAAPARPAIDTRSRGRATLGFVACLIALGSFGTWEWRHRAEVDRTAPPFKLADIAWRSVLTVAATTDPTCPASIPIVILYVKGSCLHCRAELRRWSNLIRAGGPSTCVGLAVAAAPERPETLAAWLPPSLGATLLWDHDRTVARALDVRLVPLAAYVTRDGVVISTVVGESSESLSARHLAELHAVADTSGGVIHHD